MPKSKEGDLQYVMNTEERLAEMQALATLCSVKICRGYMHYKNTADFVLTK